MSAPEPGTTLAGKYVVERVLGVGGMGVVVAARHIQLDQKVAIKYLLPDALANPEVVERFAREARAAAKIRGEHVARVIDVGNFDDGAPFMVLEYLEGENLEDLLARRGPLPIAEAVGYLLETCEALAEAHSAGVVHRDLKPANLFLAKQPDRRSIVKVLDFGISKLVDPTSQGITKTSTIMGTPFYMSPEQLIATKDVDARSDIWALGVILYELLTQLKPFMGESLAEIIGAILQNEPERASKHRAEISLDLELCIARCLASKVGDRHSSVKELAFALAPFAAPDQRSTIDKIARVLGDSLAPPRNDEPPPRSEPGPILIAASSPALQMPVAEAGLGSTHVLGSEAAAASSTRVVSDTAGTASARTAGPASPPAPVSAVTSHAVTSAVEAPPPRRSPLPKIAIGLVVVMAAAIGVAWSLRPAPHTTATHDPVGTATPTATVTAAATTTGTPSTNIVPLAVDVAAVDAAVTPPVASATPPATTRKGTMGTATSRNAPPASAATAIAATPPTPPPTTPTAAPTATASTAKNPLQMGIK